MKFHLWRYGARVGVLVTACATSQAATYIVTSTADSGAGSLRQAVLNANASLNVPDSVQFNIAGAGPHTITPVTPLPNITDPLTIDGYTQPGASVNTLSQGNNAVIQIVVQETLVIDTTNSVVQGLAVRQVQLGVAPGPKGGNNIQGNFIGLDATGTNALGSTGSGLFIQTPSNQVGGGFPSARNLISGHGTTGIEIFEAFASGNLVMNNYIGTDRTGTKAIPNTDRALVVNQNAFGNTIANNLISGNLNRGITLDGFNNLVRANYIGTDVTGQNPLGNARTGIEISGPGNTLGGTNANVGNIIAFNGVDGGGVFTTNGVDVAPGTTGYLIYGNSIFDNAGLGIDVNANQQVTAGFPVLTLASNTTTTTVIRGTHTPSTFRLELFSNVAPDPSGYGEGKWLLLSTNITTDAGGNVAINWPTALAPGLFLTATANGTSELSQARMVIAAGRINSWTNNLGGKWETGPNWSLNVAPYAGHALVVITNSGSKSVTNDATTATTFPTTLTVTNLLLSAPAGFTNTLRLAHGGTQTPLTIRSNFTINPRGALALNSGAIIVEGRGGAGMKIDGRATLTGGLLVVTNMFFGPQLFIGNTNRGSLTVSNGTVVADYAIVGVNAGSDGVWHVAGGSNVVTTTFDISDSLTATGMVLVTGGRLSLPHAYVGLFGRGSLVVSNGVMECAGRALVASQDGSVGSVIAAGGSSGYESMLLGETTTAQGSLLVTGNASIQVTNSIDNRGLVTVSGGNLTVKDTWVGEPGGDPGAVHLTGGTMTSSNLVVNANGTFTFASGTLQTRTAGISNTVPFVVGDGAGAAVYGLLGGTNWFTKGLRIAPNGLLTGTGTVQGAVTNFGGISPGVAIGSLLVTGPLMLSNSSALRFEIGGTTGGTQYDQLNISNTVVYAGTATVLLTNSFTPSAGQSFRLINALTRAGSLAAVLLPALPPGLAWTNRLTLDGSIGVVAQVTPPQLIQPIHLGDGNFQFAFSNLANAPFSVFTSTNVALPLNQWTPLGAPSQPAPGYYTFYDPNATNYPRRFYRVNSP